MPLTDDLLTQVRLKGGMEEQQLISRWERPLRQFLTPFEREILLSQQALEIGLENRLVLKIVVKRRTIAPIAGLLRLSGHLPAGLAEIARRAATGNMDFHVGIRLNPDSIHRELYLYDNPALPQLLPGLPEELPDNLAVTAYGIDELQGLSAYCTSQRNPTLLETLRPYQEAHSRRLHLDLMPHFHSTWLHYRLQNNNWQPTKYGIEFVDVPLPAATRILSAAKLPYFSYLIPRTPLRQVVIGGALGGDVSSHYFTVL